MDEQLEARVRDLHICSTEVYPHKTFLKASRYRNPLNTAVLVLCVQLLFGCGGGATEVESLPESYTCTYFIDAVSGADTNSGSSPQDAWASADRATAHTRGQNARAGDVICFKRGQRFVVLSGQLGVSGSASNPVIIGAYGDVSEVAPRLSAAIRIDDRSGWVGLGNGVLHWSNSEPWWNVSGLWWNGTWQRPASDQNLLDGSWYYEAGVGVYFRGPQRLANSGPIHLAVKYSIFGVHGLRHIVFRDLIFEYTGVAIVGRPVIPGGTRHPGAIAHLMVRDCRFEHLFTGVNLLSETVDGELHENHHIEILENRFDDIRYAVFLGALGNGPERNHYVTVAGNTIRGVAINGSYTGGKNPDIEAIAIQNVSNTYIVGNRIENGLRREQGLVNVDGELMFSTGIVLWKNPAADIDGVRIERNYIRDMEHGIIMGAGSEDGMRRVTATNNIISNCAVGLKANGTDMSQSYHIRFNTLFRNRINLYLASGGGQIVANNFSVEPVDYHLMITGANPGSGLDYNLYVPDGHFHFQTSFQSLEEFQARWLFDGHSLTANAAGFVKAVPNMPENFLITELSPARGRGVAIGLEDGDFGRRIRPVGGAVDVGAWTRLPSDD